MSSCIYEHMSLLEKAKAVTTPPTVKLTGNVKDEEIELAIAILTGEVTMKQAAQALGMRYHTNSRYWACSVLKKAHASGILDLHTLWKAPEASQSDVEQPKAT